MPQTREPVSETPTAASSQPRSLAAVLSEVGIALQEEEPTPPPPPPDAVPGLVDRRCPYCHDSLSAGEQVLCARCVTPHHAACFQEHGACSLLGCGGERSLDLAGPASRILCAACSELTPGNAPFCAKCGARHSEDALARGDPAGSRLELHAFLRSAGLLLMVAFGIGAGLGHLGRRVQESHVSASEEIRDLRSEGALKEYLRAIQRAQVAYARHDLDGDGEANFAGHVEELRVALGAAALSAPEPVPEDLVQASDDLERWRYMRGEWLVVLTATAEGRQVASGRTLRPGWSTTWACDLRGRVEPGSQAVFRSVEQ